MYLLMQTFQGDTINTDIYHVYGPIDYLEVKFFWKYLGVLIVESVALIAIYVLTRTHNFFVFSCLIPLLFLDLLYCLLGLWQRYYVVHYHYTVFGWGDHPRTYHDAYLIMRWEWLRVVPIVVVIIALVVRSFIV